MNKEISHSTSKLVHAPKEMVWSVILSPDTYKEAWQAEFSGAWVKGHKFSFSGIWDGVPYTDKSCVIDMQHEKFVEYTYWSSFWNVPENGNESCTIKYEVEKADEYSTTLTITQVGFRDDIHYAETVKLWEDTISFMKLAAEKNDLKRKIDTTFNSLFSDIDKFSDAAYNRDNSPKWTVGQIIEHIILGNTGYKDFLNSAKAESQEPYDKNCVEIRALLTNMSVALQAPEFLIPRDIEYDKEKHLAALAAINDDLISCIDTLDLTQKCTASELPPFGFLSFFEWLTFAAFHIERHQLQVGKYVGSIIHQSKT